MGGPCIFCQIVEGTSLARIFVQWPDTIVIYPLNPVTYEHLLVIPRQHVADFAEDPDVSAVTMRRAAQVARLLKLDNANLITSKGRAATQSVFHLHIHVVPRATNDGLALPWYSGKSKSKSAPTTEGKS